MIVLSTLNSTYQHTSFGLRYLKANMKELIDQTEIIEFTIQIHPRDIVEMILEKNPKIVGLGVYIWNAEQSLQVVSLLKKIAPEVIVVIGGPEVTYESEKQEIVQIADYLIKGESDFEFHKLCQTLLSGERPEIKIRQGLLPEIKEIQLPYHLYSDEDLKNRILYVEASRGCPYKCEYCLSSLDKSVRSFSQEKFLTEIDTLIARGARSFKFVDRTFNLSPTTSIGILEFFLARIELGLFLHFEMVPDRLPTELKELIKKFPPGSLQFEVGIQTWNPEVAALVSRKNDLNKVKENFKFLTQETGVHIHADLIVGLPGESLESFGIGFNALHQLGPDEIQVGILKRLKGTPIIRHDQAWGMTYQAQQPFQILKTKHLSFQEVQFMNKFAKFWNLYANSGNFKESMALFGQDQIFNVFSDFVHYLNRKSGLQIHFSLENLFEHLWKYFTVEKSQAPEEVEALIVQDYCHRVKRRDLPSFLKRAHHVVASPQARPALQKRQQQHLGAT